MPRSASTLALAACLLAACDSAKPEEEMRNVLDPVLTITVDSDPDWSPDGRSIAYTHWTRQVWVIDIRTKARRFVASGFDPHWSPDGQHIAYTCGSNVCRVEVATGTVTQLTTWGNCFFPHWSPEGTKIAFDTNHGDPKGAAAIWVMDADGSNKRDISVHGTGEWRDPSWVSEDKILHLRNVRGAFGEEMFLMNSDGSQGRRLTTDDRVDRHPAFSPQAGKIAWTAIEKGLGPRTGIWTMDPNGTGQRLVVPYGWYPAWSPDGRQIAYFADYAENIGSLWIANADGTNRQLLTRREDYLPAQ